LSARQGVRMFPICCPDISDTLSGYFRNQCPDVAEIRNLQYIWEEYKAKNSDGLSYSRYCKRYSDWKNETGKNVIMVQNREPGKELFVDWMGDTLDCVIDSATGELKKAHFFVTSKSRRSMTLL
jgi:transposase